MVRKDQILGFTISIELFGKGQLIDPIATAIVMPVQFGLIMPG
jgi:hypothetical protein